MRPADFYVFVEAKPKSGIFLAEQDDVIGVATKVGARCSEQDILIKDENGFRFGSLKEGDQIAYRHESIFWTFMYDGKPINCLSIKDIKCCFPQ